MKKQATWELMQTALGKVEELLNEERAIGHEHQWCRKVVNRINAYVLGLPDPWVINPTYIGDIAALLEKPVFDAALALTTTQRERDFLAATSSVAYAFVAGPNTKSAVAMAGWALKVCDLCAQ